MNKIKQMHRITTAKILFVSCSMLSLLFSSTTLLAVSTAPTKMINFWAERTECNEKQHLCIYTGKVHFTDSIHHLEAPKVTIYRDNDNNIDRLVAVGNPAHYYTLPTDNKVPLTAQAQTIEFYTKKTKLFC